MVVPLLMARKLPVGCRPLCDVAHVQQALAQVILFAPLRRLGKLSADGTALGEWGNVRVSTDAGTGDAHQAQPPAEKPSAGKASTRSVGIIGAVGVVVTLAVAGLVAMKSGIGLPTRRSGAADADLCRQERPWRSRRDADAFGRRRAGGRCAALQDPAGLDDDRQGNRCRSAAPSGSARAVTSRPISPLPRACSGSRCPTLRPMVPAPAPWSSKAMPAAPSSASRRDQDHDRAARHAKRARGVARREPLLMRPP